jgi:hypothetical protein
VVLQPRTDVGKPFVLASHSVTVSREEATPHGEAGEAAYCSQADCYVQRAMYLERHEALTSRSIERHTNSHVDCRMLALTERFLLSSCTFWVADAERPRNTAAAVDAVQCCQPHRTCGTRLLRLHH